MEKHQAYFNLFDALKEKGCPICFLIRKIIRKSMDDFLYEGVNDSSTRKEIRESLGYCALHTWQLQKFGDGFGMSIIYEDLLGIVKDKIKRAARTKIKDIPEALIKELLQNKTRLGYHEKTRQICPICRNTKDVERRYISSFIKYFNDPEFNVSFRESFGLCLPHLATTIRICKDKNIISGLTKIEMKKLEFLKQELAEFQRKHDYHFSHEGFGKEGDAWIRAIEKMVGKEGIF